MTNYKPLVISHGNCFDGTTAANVAYRYFKDQAEYAFGHYGEPVVEGAMQAGRDVYMIDFTYKRPVLDAMLAEGVRVHIIDHHKTAQADLGDLKGCATLTFDMARSGAALAWLHFFPGLPMPRFVKLIEDRDLWKFEYGGHTRLVHKAIWLDGFNDEEQWQAYLEDGFFNEALPSLLTMGDALQAADDRALASLKDKAMRFEWEGHPCACVNYPFLQSEAGEAMALMSEGVGIVWWRDKEMFRVSLRSKGSLDVSAIAKRHGGGGHANAAGFECAKLPFPMGG